MSTEASRPPAARLRIEPILSQAAELERRVSAELPTHQGLANAAGLVVRAAGTAQSVAAAMKRPLSLHRLPVLFLAAAFLGLGAFLVWQLAWSSTLTLALPDRDAAHLCETSPHAPSRVNIARFRAS